MKGNIASHDVIRVLQKKGWYHVGTKGSHWQFKHPTKRGRVTVPHPNKSLGVGTIKSILKQAGLTDKEFEECLKC